MLNFLCVFLDNSNRWKASCFLWNGIFLSIIELLLCLSTLDLLYGMNVAGQNQKTYLFSFFSPIVSTRHSDISSILIGGISGTYHCSSDYFYLSV